MTISKNMCILGIVASICVVIITIVFCGKNITNTTGSVTPPPKPQTIKKPRDIYKIGNIPLDSLPEHQKIANMCENCYRPIENAIWEYGEGGCVNCSTNIFNSVP